MKTLFALLVMGMAVGCASAEADPEVSESQDELSARSACRGKKAGATCSLCGNKPNCVETMELKTCQKRGTSLSCKSGSTNPPPASYDPCGGKNPGDNCTICAPGDADCFETQEVKTCNPASGKLTCGAAAPTSNYAPCGGKNPGDSCTLCKPGDADCVEIAIPKYCDAKGACGGGSPITTQ